LSRWIRRSLLSLLDVLNMPLSGDLGQLDLLTDHCVVNTCYRSNCERAQICGINCCWEIFKHSIAVFWTLDVFIGENWIRKIWKGAVKKSRSVGIEKNHEISVRRAGAVAEIRTEYLPNTSLERPCVSVSHNENLYIFSKVKVKLSLCLTNSALCPEDVWESGCIDPGILDLGTRWRWLVSFLPRPLYPRGKSPRYQLDRRLGGPKSSGE
jgi:hypothetical protein